MNPSQLLLKAPPPSEDAAATSIQALYRGFSVRRTQPLQHLRIICEVRSELKRQLGTLAVPAQFDMLCKDRQERLKWSEGAMALLLRLDAIQGAHPVVRDHRRSVTREVIVFQEIIDSTSKDVVPQKGPQHFFEGRDEKHLRDLFYAFQHLGWLFLSSVALKRHDNW